VAPSVAIIGTRGYPSYYGGFETAVRKLAPYLVDAGWDVSVYGRKAAVKAGDPGLDARVRSIFTPGIESKSLSTLTYGLTSVVNAARRRPDVALVMNVANGYWLPVLNARRIPSLVNVDGIEWDRAKWGRMAKAVFHNGARTTARWGTRMVYDSRVIAQRWRDEFGLEGEFIPYGGDVPPELPVVEGLSHRGYVLVVARFVPENTIPEFFDAVTQIAQYTDVVIVGSAGYGGDLDQRAETLSRDHPRVQWTGHLRDDQKLNSLWQHAGAYFHGHSVGGTNPALVQAMACGTPIVARDTLYNREVLGNGGVFVSPEPNAIAEGVLGLMKDSAQQEQLSAIAFARSREFYSWESVCASYESALRSLMRGSRAKGPMEK
jgi:glycosyltransferase involved in cell wall biosynthesis